MSAFHCAFLVRDLAATRTFYVDLIGCTEGRSAPTWVDFDFFGHPLSAHLGDPSLNPANLGLVDGKQVPMPHFGAILEWAAFDPSGTALEFKAFRAATQVFAASVGYFGWVFDVELAEGLPALSSGLWSPSVPFSGQTEKAGHFLQPTARAMGQSVMESLRSLQFAEHTGAPVQHDAARPPVLKAGGGLAA